MGSSYLRVRLKLFSLLLAVQITWIHLVSAQNVHKINILHLNEIGNQNAVWAIKSVDKYIKENPSLGISFNISTVEGNNTDLNGFLEKMCSVYSEAVKDNQPPHLVLDTTKKMVISELVKAFTSALGLPTISTSFGQHGDSQKWRDLNEQKQKYLLQVLPPLDTIPDIVRTIVIHMNISNAAVLFDEAFVIDHKYKSLLQNLPTRHVITTITKDDKRKQIVKLRNLDINNFFVLGSLKSTREVLEAADGEFFKKNFAWYVITYSTGNFYCNCTNSTFIFVQPNITTAENVRLNPMKMIKNAEDSSEIVNSFYYDVTLRSLLTIKNMLDINAWPPNLQYMTCAEYNGSITTERSIELKSFFTKINQNMTVGQFYFPKPNGQFNGNAFVGFKMDVSSLHIKNGENLISHMIGDWMYKSDINFYPGKIEKMLKLKAATIYRVLTVVQPPFIMVDNSSKSGYKGYCIDLLDEIAKSLQFEYEIKEMEHFGEMNEEGEWNGIVKALIDKEADIGLGTMAVMAERETVIDFTVPFYDLVGITILMQLPRSPRSLFKFLTVLETDVWLCILGAYFFTSFLMYIFDRWSPYSYQNNREKYIDDDEKREFNMKECLWFCMTSLTPQGGGEAPKNLSGRLVAATWWLFGFIIIASYTANLAAFLTVSRLDTPIESLDDLAKQYKVLYATIDGSPAMTYFERMSQIEGRFYEIWKEMSLNDSLTPVERSKLAVWDYPVSDKYTKIWQAMQEAGLPKTLDEAVKRVRKSTPANGFAFIGDATDIRYLQITNCDLQVVGEEFSRKPYAIGIQQGSPLKSTFDTTILRLLNDRFLEKLKDKWWRKRMHCEKIEDQADGISIQNIGGVFIVIFIGIGMACITLVFEYWWYKHRKPMPRIINVAESGGKKQSGGVAGIIVGTNMRNSDSANLDPSMIRSRNINQINISKTKY